MDETQLTQSLIGFDTVSPPGNEEKCARYIGDFLKDLHVEGSSVELYRFASGRANVVATFPGDSPGLMLAGHIDVVPPGDASAWSSPPFEGRVRDDKVYGRGAADMKGGVAAMLVAIASARRKKLKRSLSFVGTGGEEIGYDGLRVMIGAGKLEGLKARCGLVGEPTEMSPVRGHRGSLVTKAEFHGKPAHSSDPSLGVNSIEKAVVFVEALQALRKELAKAEDPDLGHAILTPTIIQGGTKSNVIPASCVLTMDGRTVPGIESRTILDGLAAVMESIRRKDRTFSADIEVLYETAPLSIGAKDEVVKLAEAITGSPSTIAAYATEAADYTKLGIPSIVLGPGSIKQAHIYDEFVAVTQLKAAVSAYGRFISTVCG